jgi:hypothetical protein
MRRIGPFKIENPRSWGEYVDLIAGPKYQGWAFRGHANRKWPLMSTLGRYLNTYVEEKYWKDQEQRIIRVFKRKAHLFLTHIPDHSDTFQWLALMQHHGAPTRPLDLTWSPYVAAFFALERATRKGAVWALNPRKLENITERLNEFLEDSHGAEIGIGEPFVMNTYSPIRNLHCHKAPRDPHRRHRGRVRRPCRHSRQVCPTCRLSSTIRYADAFHDECHKRNALSGPRWASTLACI